MSFKDQLQQEIERTAQGGGKNEKVDFPSNDLKHKQLYFSKDTPQHTVRILPGANGNFFANNFRDIFLNARNKKGDEFNMNIVIGDEDNPDNSKFMEQLVQWQQEKRVPNRFNKEQTPTTRYFVNAVNVFMQGEQAVMETDENGQLVVRLLKLPSSAYREIINKLSDPMQQPQGSGEEGFISAQNAYPIGISKPSPGGMSYGVDVYQRFDLGPLPQGWEQQLEDLEYQATPTEQYNGDFLDYFIDVVNGVEGQGSSDNGNSGGGQTMSTPPKQNFNQGNTQGNQAPQQNFNQAPQQPQQGFNQNQGQGQGFNQAPPVQQTPPNQNVEDNMPTAINNMPDANQGPVQQAPQQPQGQQQEPQQNTQQAPQQAPQTPPQQESQPQAPQGEAQDINSVLAKMQKGASE